MKKIEQNSLYWALLRISIIPIVLLVLVITALSTKSLADSIGQEAQKGLKNLSNTILMMYDELYPGDYHVINEDGSVTLFKGEYQISGDFSIVDKVKEHTDADVTFFYQDIRILTTIMDDQGGRMTGTKSNPVVTKDVLESGEEAFYPSVLIDNKKYFAYYAPLSNSDGSCVGMIFVGKPSEYVDGLVRRAILPILLLAITAILLAGFFTIRFSGKLVDAIRKMEEFLEKVTSGNLRAQLDLNVLRRNDELGGMGKHAVMMQKSLRELIEQDILTKLYNRRSGEKMLAQVQSDFRKTGVPFSIALGDVDYFKKVNDTYGHECGDIVLIHLADKLKAHMHRKGFAVRWGGEEFLLIFENYGLEDTVKSVEELMEQIRNTGIDYQKEKGIRITMTFGIVEGSKEKIDYIIREADEKLYLGKKQGRDRVVY
ncbi:MAG: diguanylate cyclase [Lachnospiraceae bacterium]|nr:diguanylate cyclase [Lachnospiraceae bacterium]MDE6186339.1 diguanylate cyclase [Lachnospiraceae bacterium]